MASAAIHPAEETRVREVLADLSLPSGVKLKRVEIGEDYSGDPALWVYFAVSKSKPLTKRRVAELAKIYHKVWEKTKAAKIPQWPYVRFVEVR